jgi:tRNA-specific 2-thiouridylase
LQKSEVREIAASQDLITAGKKDSQGLCFIGKVRLPDFLQQQLKPKEGQIVEIDADVSAAMPQSGSLDHDDPTEDELITLSRKRNYQPSQGKVVGTHQGAHFFTRGQRKGLAVGGTPEPLFVLNTDVTENVIYAGQGKNHAGLFRHALFVDVAEAHWIREDLRLQSGEKMDVMARIRYRQQLEPATLHCFDSGLYVYFKNKQSAISAGQFVAWYENSECLGSGVISDL